MRWLKVSYVLSRAGRPVLLSATLLGACGRTSTVRGVDARAAGHDSEVREIVLVLPADAGGLSRDGQGFEPGGPVVPTPAGPTLASLPGECIDLGALFDAGAPAFNALAARVTLQWSETPSAAETSVGLIRVAPEIAGLVVGNPSVNVVAKIPTTAPDPVITNLRSDKEGYKFDVSWSPVSPREVCMNAQEPSWTFRTSLRLRCGTQERAIESFTTVALCGASGRTWASSGEACSECATVCEMAPSPLVPAEGEDDLPLGAALKVAVKPLLRAGDAVVLLADHTAAPGLHYAWQVSAGVLQRLDPDLVLWRLPEASTPRPQLAQVAVTGADLAAVASFRWDQ